MKEKREESCTSLASVGLNLALMRKELCRGWEAQAHVMHKHRLETLDDEPCRGVQSGDGVARGWEPRGGAHWPKGAAAFSTCQVFLSLSLTAGRGMHEPQK